MRHCCQFRADDIYYLEENDIYTTRRLSIGFCPICGKPVAELVEWRFDGAYNNQTLSGIHANSLMLSLKDDIVYSVRDMNYRKFKSKPYGWKYGVNKSRGKNHTSQFAYDFYGNKELVKVT